MAPKLYELLTKWIKIIPTPYLIFSSNGEKVSTPQITKYNNDLWGGKHVSTNLYRHSYITKFYSGQMPSFEQMNALSKLMSHSVTCSIQYAKKDAKV
jgi:hypothetical protein